MQGSVLFRASILLCSTGWPWTYSPPAPAAMVTGECHTTGLVTCFSNNLFSDWCVCVYLNVLTHAHTYGGQRSTLDIFLNHPLPLFLRQILSEPGLADLAGQPFPSAEITGAWLFKRMLRIELRSSCLRGTALSHLPYFSDSSYNQYTGSLSELFYCKFCTHLLCLLTLIVHFWFTKA